MYYWGRRSQCCGEAEEMVWIAGEDVLAETRSRRDKVSVHDV